MALAVPDTWSRAMVFFLLHSMVLVTLVGKKRWPRYLRLVT
jgi:hypothetical protein